MRRQRFLRAASAQNVCVFCACRLAGTSSSVPATPFSRPLSNSRRANQETPSTTAPPPPAPLVQPDPPKGFVFDPNSKLSRSEQLQRATVRAARLEQEKRQQEQERKQREAQEAQLLKAEEERRARREQQSRGSENTQLRFSIKGRGSGNARQSLLPTQPSQGASTLRIRKHTVPSVGDSSRESDVTSGSRPPGPSQGGTLRTRQQTASDRHPPTASVLPDRPQSGQGRRADSGETTPSKTPQASRGAQEVSKPKMPSPKFAAATDGGVQSDWGSGDLQIRPARHGRVEDDPPEVRNQSTTPQPSPSVQEQSTVQQPVTPVEELSASVQGQPPPRPAQSPDAPLQTRFSPPQPSDRSLAPKSAPTVSRTSFLRPTAGGRSGSYQTTPFKPEEFPDPGFDVKQAEQWTHLRPKTASQLPSAPAAAASAPSSGSTLSWIDASFEKHRAARLKYTPMPQPSPDYDLYARTAGVGSSANTAKARCARCGKEGHAAWNCDAPPDTARHKPSGQRAPLRISRVISQTPDSNERETYRPVRHARDQSEQPRVEPAPPKVIEQPAVDARREADLMHDRRRQKWAIEEDKEEEVSTKSRKKEYDRKRSRSSRNIEREVDDDDFEFDYIREENEGIRAKRAARKARREAERAEKKAQAEAKKLADGIPISLPEYSTVATLAQLLNVRYEELVQRLEALGYDDVFPGKALNFDTSSLIAMEYGFVPSDAAADVDSGQDLVAQPELVDKSSLPQRPPVVTIMGHVDHGKTTILDYLRKSSIVAGEAGGITQHIGAFSVPLASSGKTVTFLDTPGHAAFLAMRQRGANVTDIVILVVAADDSVKPQTLEAIKHAKAAGVPMIVAVNKIDKDQADIRRVKDDLARHGVEIEDFGGETQVVPVSGKTGQGMDELEENVVTLSEILDHRAEVDGGVEGWVLEASTKKSGKVATVLIRRGTLSPGNILVAGTAWARVRTLHNEGGQSLDSVGPGMPVEVDGWRDLPAAGDEVLEAPSEQKAGEVVEYRTAEADRLKIASDMEAINEARRLRQDQREETTDDTAETKPDASQPEQSGPATVPFIIKADVSGSAEAVSAYIQSIASPFVTPLILDAAVGPVHESDVERADASRGHIIAFNVPHDEAMKKRAESLGVRILENNIIYRVLDDVKAVLEEKLPPIVTQRVLGEAEVGAAFEIGVGGRKKIRIAGCKVRNGMVGKGSQVRVLRGEEKIYDGIISSLKNVKKDVQEMRKGTECGMGFEGWQEFETGDVIQTYETISEKRTL